MTFETPIAEVTVHPDCARVTRRGRIELDVGVHDLDIVNLPETLKPESVRAGGRGTGLRILGAGVGEHFVSRSPEISRRELQQDLDTLQDQDAELADREEETESRLHFVEELRRNSGSSLARAVAFGKATIETVTALEDHLLKQGESLRERRREVVRQRRDLKRRIEAAKARSQQVDGKGSIRRRSVRIGVEAVERVEAEIEISYVVDGASWDPAYDIRLIDDSVTLTYLAHIRQQSGEDWPETHLTLSTARPAASATLPELKPWYLNSASEPRVRLPDGVMMMRSAGPAGAPESDGSVDSFLSEMTDAEPPPEAEIAEAEVTSSGASVTYRVARPIAIDSDGTERETTITTLDLGADLDHLTAPKQAEHAFLRATIRNGATHVLLPGTASIFRGPEFVGTTKLKNVAPNAEFAVQLGVDDRVKVERRLRKHATTKNLLGGKRRLRRGYTIELTSFLPGPGKITVLDQLPLPRHESINVKLEACDPRPKDHSDLNLLTWELELQPEKPMEIAYAFAIEHPREMRLSGLGDD